MVPTPPIESTMGLAASTSCVVDTDVSLSAMSRMATSVLGSPSFSASDLMVSGVDLVPVFWLVATLCERGSVVTTSAEVYEGVDVGQLVATPLWAKCEGEAHTPKSGKLESSGTPENSEHKCRGQISSHLNALGVIEKVLKRRCPKWPRMSHLDICSPSYGQKKGRESNCHFDSRPFFCGSLTPDH
jgi:hypothetical protein